MYWALAGYNHLYIDPVWQILQFWIFVMIMFNAFDKVNIKPNIWDILHTRLHEIFVIKQHYFYFVISFRLALPISLFSDVWYNRTKLHFFNYVDNPYHKKIVKKRRPKHTRIKLLSRDFVTSEKKPKNSQDVAVMLCGNLREKTRRSSISFHTL